MILKCVFKKEGLSLNAGAQAGHEFRIQFAARIGIDGKSAYQLWLELGNTGTVEQFIAWQRQPSVDAAAKATTAATLATTKAAAADSAAAAAAAAATSADTAATNANKVATGIDSRISGAETKIVALETSDTAIREKVGQLETATVQTVETITGATATLNVLGDHTYLCENLTSLTLSTIENSPREAVIRFMSGATATTLTLPVTLKIIGYAKPAANKAYEISIRSGAAVIVNF